MGILKDKEAEKIVRLTCDAPSAVITTSDSENPRSMPPLLLADLVRPYCANVTAADSPQEAAELARLLAGKDGVVVGLRLPVLSEKAPGKHSFGDTSDGGNHGKQRKN